MLDVDDECLAINDHGLPNSNWPVFDRECNDSTCMYRELYCRCQNKFNMDKMYLHVRINGRNI